jgi:hypothetical protein
MDREDKELARKLLSPQGLTLIYTPIIRKKDLHGALRRAVIILYTYLSGSNISSDAPEDSPQGFSLNSWLEAIAIEIEDYQNKTTIELLNSLTSLSDLSTIIQEIYINLGFSTDDIQLTLEHRLFGISYRTLSSDFAFLSDPDRDRWLKVEKQGNTNYF